MPRNVLPSGQSSAISMIWQSIVLPCLIIICFSKSSLGENATERNALETMIWQRLLMSKLLLSQDGSHVLRLLGLRPEDVFCLSLETENHYTCKVHPEKISIYWLVTMKDYPVVVRVLTADIPFVFKGLLNYCDSGQLSFELDEEQYAYIQYYHLEYSGGDINKSAMIRGLLEHALQFRCSENVVYEYDV